MSFRLKGILRHSGQNVNIVLDCESEREALAQATAMNLVVSSIERIDSATAHASLPEKNEQMAAIEGATERVLRRRTLAQTGRPPTYSWLNALGIGYSAVGALVLVISFIMAIVILLAGANSGRSYGPATAAAASMFELLSGAFMGGMFLAVGQGLLAFRDIARNSWSLPRIEKVLSENEK